jgi:hypothetical protein
MLSAARIARLKRFDLDWQATLAALPAGHLSAAAQHELAALRGTAADNLKALDAEAVARARIMPLVPFAQPIIDLYEARVRMANMDARATAGIVNSLRRTIAGIHAQMEAGLSDTAPAAALRLDRERAVETADVVANLHAHLTAWFNHYDGYDPLFMWWVGLPYRQVTEALTGYETLLRERVAEAGHATANVPAIATSAIAPDPPPAIPSVPDLAEILALPQDELRDIVQRFRAGLGGGRGRGGAGAAGLDYFRAWLAALPSLDFATLSRNAQVDYLHIRTTSTAWGHLRGAGRPERRPAGAT